MIFTVDKVGSLFHVVLHRIFECLYSSVLGAGEMYSSGSETTMNKSGLKIENMWDTFLSREFTYSSGLHSNRTVGTRAPWVVFMKLFKLIWMERLQILSLPDHKS